ncbi:MAG: histone deacetylase [Myxococcales bacterium]|nr:histone deacetylase [Myxococcales bacterium]MCB9575922.1 histone deacetylase [Polyangiaceae bacterium]
MLKRIANRVRRWASGHAVPIWLDPAYRLPFASIEAQTGFEPRRSDLVAFHLLSVGAISDRDLRRPVRVRYEDLARVHTQEWLEQLNDPQVLGNVFAVDPSDVVVDEVLSTVRLACGGTLNAARASLGRRGPTMNLLGGFHHAGPSRGGGFCALNDIAVAVAALRAEGFKKRVVVVDLDAHPPDGLAECFEGDPSVWVGSLSGTSWGPMPSVDETALPPDCDDDSYMAALSALLGRMPPAGLVFVIAGGDVLAGDRLGGLSLSLMGARRRDLAVYRAIVDVPSVWLPGGGYSSQAWRVLAGTALAICLESTEPIPEDADPLSTEFSAIAREIRRDELEGALVITEADLMSSLERRGHFTPRLLDFYTSEGLEYALSRYGVLEQLRRLGYGAFRVAVDRSDQGDRMRVFAKAEGKEHLLIEVVLEKRRVAEEDVLYVHWLTLRHPRGRFSDQRPRLPGQEEPGLGLAREAGQLLARTAERLGLAGIAFRPAWLHTAYAARYAMRFVDPGRQGRFEALLRDLASVPLKEATLAVAEGRVRLNGEPYTWEADEMVYWLAPHDADAGAIAEARDAAKFELLP